MTDMTTTFTRLGGALFVLAGFGLMLALAS